MRLTEGVKISNNYCLRKQTIIVCARCTPPPDSVGSVSLRFGHATALTVHRTVIHYRSAASLPRGGSLIFNLPQRINLVRIGALDAAFRTQGYHSKNKISPKEGDIFYLFELFVFHGNVFAFFVINARRLSILFVAISKIHFYLLSNSCFLLFGKLIVIQQRLHLCFERFLRVIT